MIENSVFRRFTLANWEYDGRNLKHARTNRVVEEARNGFMKPKQEAVGLSRRYSNFFEDPETIDILLELGRYIKEL